MVRKIVAVCMLLNKNNEVLLQKKTNDYKSWPGGVWSFFGRTIKKSETPKEAIIREIKEEINIDLKDSKLLKIQSVLHQQGLK